VTVTPGFDEGAAITGYTLTVADLSDPSDPSNGMLVTAATSPITVTGLTPGDTYAFTATATNALGTSQPSSASVGVVVPGGTAPAAAPAAVTGKEPKASRRSAATVPVAPARPARGRRAGHRAHGGSER
jgi:hypothetical protein